MMDAVITVLFQFLEPVLRSFRCCAAAASDASRAFLGTLIELEIIYDSCCYLSTSSFASLVAGIQLIARRAIRLGRSHNTGICP